MNFGEKVRELRKAQNISQTALADMLHVSRRTICGWELEDRFPKERHIVHSHVSRRTICGWELEDRYPKERHIVHSLAEILDCPVDYLLTDKPGIVSDAYEKFGNNQSLISRNILLDVDAYFTSSYISQEEKDTLMFAIHESYIEARKANSDTWKQRKMKYPESIT